MNHDLSSRNPQVQSTGVGMGRNATANNPKKSQTQGGPSPKQLKFRIEYSSGEDPEFPSSELNTHSPQTKGWQTPPFCDYPQEIGLTFLDGPVQLSQLQILSHESKIATKIDVYVGEGYDYGSCTFKRLGYLSLDSNERSDYAARELKSVYISARGQFLKLSIHKCHLNRHNMYNQAGIVAINVLGFSLPPTDNANHNPVQSSKAYMLNNPANPSSQVRPWDDLAFDMNFDPHTAQKIREVHEAKEIAVEEEEYELAKKLKNAENHLKAQGIQLAKLEQEKSEAVKMEDYDRAQVIKQEINRIRGMIHDQIAEALPPSDIPKEINTTMVNRHAIPQRPQIPLEPQHTGDIPSPVNDIHSPYEQQNPIHNRMHNPVHNQMGMDPVAPQQQHSMPRHHMHQLHHSSIPGEDDRPLPALSNQGNMHPSVHQQYDMPMNEEMSFDNDGGNLPPNTNAPATMMSPEEIAEALDGVEGVDELPEADEIPVAMATEASQLSEVFDEYIVRCLFSSHVRLRTAALNKIELDLNNSDRFDMSDTITFSRICAVIKMSTTDKVANVYITGVRLFGDIIEKVMERGKLSKTTVHENIEQFMQNIVDKLGDIGGRVREASYKVLLQLANANVVGVSFVSSYVLKPLRPGKTMLWRPLLARLRLVTEYVREFKLQAAPTGNKSSNHLTLNLKSVMGLITANNGHLHPNSNVRDIAKELTMELYRLEGAAVLPHLRDFRRKQVEEYQEGFAQVDDELKREHLFAGLAFGNGSAEIARNTPHHSYGGGGGGKSSTSPIHSHRKKDKSSNSENNTGGNVNININLQTSPTGSKVSVNNGNDDKNLSLLADEDDEIDFHDQPFTCQFCGRQDETFTEENLDLHFWKRCPMLTSCSKCEQIIEVSTLNEHLLHECSMKDNHKECPRCGEAIAEKFYKMHVKRNSCLPKKPLSENSRCPLCHKNIPPGERGWLKHLLSGTGCPKNDRTKNLREPN